MSMRHRVNRLERDWPACPDCGPVLIAEGESVEPCTTCGCTPNAIVIIEEIVPGPESPS